MSPGGRLTRPLRSRVGGQAVDRLQQGQPPQGGLHAPRRGGPRRVLVVGAIAAAISRITVGEGRVALALQVDRMVVVQGEPLPVILGQFALRVEGGQPCGPGLLPGRGMLVAGDVEQVHRLSGQEPAVLASFGHAPHHRGHPAAGAQGAQHPSHLFIVQVQHRGQVGHAGQGHPGGYFQQSSFIVVQWLPGHHRRTSVLPWDKSRWLVPSAGKPEPGSGARPAGPLGGSPAALLGDAPLYMSGSGLMVLADLILNIRLVDG